MIIEWGDDGAPRSLKGEFVRDEQEQAACICELLEVLQAEGVDSAFVNTFARYDLPHDEDPSKDFDLASYGVVKVLRDRMGHAYPGMPWEPKAAFNALAEYYAR